MRKIREKKCFSRGVFAALLVLAVMTGSISPGEAAVSLEDERVAGESFVQDIKKHFDVVEDPCVQDYISHLGKYLISALETRPFPFSFYVIRDPSLNAFAGPGGHIFVFSGLLEIMDNADELAAVICHEIGHVSARHLAQRVEQNKKMGLATLASVLAAVLIGGDASGAIVQGSLAAGMQAQLHYSRNDERQADQLGYKYLEASGFHPEGMIGVLKKLQGNQWVEGGAVPPYLLTHPGANERIARAEEMAAGEEGSGGRPEAETFRTQYGTFKTIVTALDLDPDEALGRFQKALEGEGEAWLAHLGMGIAFMRLSEYGKASEHLEAARVSRPGMVDVLVQLAKAYQYQGRDGEAVGVLERALREEPGNGAAMAVIAKSYQNLELYAKAVQVYEKLKAMEPENRQVLHDLGVAYGRQNRLDLAHYHFGLYFKGVGDKRLARYHFTKAREFAPGGQALADKIREALDDLQ